MNATGEHVHLRGASTNGSASPRASDLRSPGGGRRGPVDSDARRVRLRPERARRRQASAEAGRSRAGSASFSTTPRCTTTPTRTKPEDQFEATVREGRRQRRRSSAASSGATRTTRCSSSPKRERRESADRIDELLGHRPVRQLQPRARVRRREGGRQVTPRCSRGVGRQEVKSAAFAAARLATQTFRSPADRRRRHHLLAALRRTSRDQILRGIVAAASRRKASEAPRRAACCSR